MITLRPVEDADEPILFAHQADPEWAATAQFPSRDREAHLAHWRKIQSLPDVVNRSVLVDGELCGSIGSWVDEDGRRLVGYGFGRAFWGRGIATEALRQFLDDAVIERPIYAFVAESNVGSQRVLEKCGFVLADDQPGPAEDGVEERFYILR
jgi:RimJ/RimL family protein N-acetyltransferase